MAKKEVKIAGYTLKKSLGKGESSETFLAVREGDETEYVLKKLQSDFVTNAAYRKLFKSQSQVVLDYPQDIVVPIKKVVFAEDCLAIVYPRIKAKPISDLWKKEALPLSRVIELFRPLADALDYYHSEHFIIHGALHPENLKYDEEERLYLLDMGLCKDASWMDYFELSFYKSPEQLKDRRNTPESDRYCFALLVYCALAGSFPWGKKTPLETTVELKVQDKLQPLSSHVYTIDSDLLEGVNLMLSSNPEERLQSCAELISLMDEALRRQEETDELGIDPEVLAKAQQDVGQLDRQLSLLERKISGLEKRMKQAQANRDSTLERMDNRINSIQSRFSIDRIEAEKRLKAHQEQQQEWGNRLKFFFSKKLADEAAEKTIRLEEKWVSVGQELEEAIEKEQARTIEEREKCHSDYQKTMARLMSSLEPVRTKYRELEEEMFEVGELHPRLLGFRAKKQFSLATLRVGSVTNDMILLPKGNFSMGDERLEGAEADEVPVHIVQFKRALWWLATPVTQELYRAVIGSNPSAMKNPKNPVEMITWFDAIQFCNILSLRESLQPVYVVDEQDDTKVSWNRNASGFRLPTEAEWEYAARAGSPFPFSGSENLSKVAWSSENSGGHPHAVAEKEPNAWKLYDMSGNVWEWCWDWRGFYSDGEEQDPVGPKEGSGRVYRGGSCLANEKLLRVHSRGFEHPNTPSDATGFRIVRDPR